MFGSLTMRFDTASCWQLEVVTELPGVQAMSPTAATLTTEPFGGVVAVVVVVVELDVVELDVVELEVVDELSSSSSCSRCGGGRAARRAVGGRRAGAGPVVTISCGAVAVVWRLS